MNQYCIDLRTNTSIFVRLLERLLGRLFEGGGLKREDRLYSTRRRKNSFFASNIIRKINCRAQLNFKEILSQENVDGVLVGSASLDIEEFNKIIEF